MKNGVMMQFFEWNLPNDGSLWRMLRHEAPHLHAIGVTSIWIPPAYKADEQADEGYATYDLYDFGEFDQKQTIRTKYGTREELERAIETLHRLHISVYLDAVLNHKMGGDRKERFRVVQVDPEDRNHLLSEPFEIESFTAFDFPARGDRYSSFKWHWYHFSGVDYNAATGEMGIFRVLGEGKQWSDEVDRECGNYDYLLGNDLDFNHPDVVAEIKHWAVWATNEFGFDGFRLDALKHIQASFICELIDTVRQERGERFYAVGEYWNEEYAALAAYIEQTAHRIDLFDVPLHFHFHAASLSDGAFDLRNLMEDTVVRHHPSLAVTFVDNHDSQRGSSLESPVASWFKPLAYGIILLQKAGYPCIFYGDYYGTQGAPSPHRAVLDRLLEARHRRAYGEQIDYFDHPELAGFTRTGDQVHLGSGLALLISIGEHGEKRMFVGEHHRGERWHELTGSVDGEVEIDETGFGLFRVEGGKLAVWAQR